MVNVKAPAAAGDDVPLRCPVCEGVVMFRLLVAEVRSIPFRQTHAHRWRRMQPDLAHAPLPIPIGCICDGCSHLMPVPASLIDAFKKAASNRRP